MVGGCTKASSEKVGDGDGGTLATVSLAVGANELVSSLVAVEVGALDTLGLSMTELPMVWLALAPTLGLALGLDDS